MVYNEIPKEILDKFQNGVVIPALPLALTEKRQLDETRQRALMRYYLDAGAGGVAVGVHSTQFEIRLPEHNLFKPVLNIAREEFDRFDRRGSRPIIRIAGIIGKTKQAISEARTAVSLGYHAGLLSVGALKEASNEELLAHCRAVAEEIPLIGFYLQPAVGGRKLNVDFWRDFANIPNVIGIKMAPFNRYQTLDVVRGVVESGRSDGIALYTGNDDNILIDLLSEYQITHDGKIVRKRIVGGLLGHWAVWTRQAAALLEQIHKGELGMEMDEILTKAIQVTDCNAAFFDAANSFSGCIPGIHEVLRRQGLLKGIWTLNKNESLSPGQMDEIDRVYAAYPQLNDDAFVQENLDKWLS